MHPGVSTAFFTTLKAGYFSFAYFALASFRMGMSGYGIFSRNTDLTLPYCPLIAVEPVKSAPLQDAAQIYIR